MQADLIPSQATIKMIAARAKAAQSLTENIPSPCISVCRMDVTRSLCTGCFRRSDEIAIWGSADDATKRAIWAHIAQRLPALERRTEAAP